MRKAVLFSLFILLTVMLIVSCSNDKKTNPDTESPTVTITYPPNNSSFVLGTVINIVAEADDNEEVDNVKFYIDGVELYEDTNDPYMYNWDTTDLSGSHTIYAKVTDSSENTSTSDIVTVTITDSVEAPNPPSNPNPQSGATNISTNTTLSWTCTDPNGDQLTYDVYFSTSTNPSLVNSGQSNTTFNPGTLNDETTYYWKIVAHDNHSNSTIGDVWWFMSNNQPPNPPNNLTPANNATSVSVNTNISWECCDPENDPLTYDVYFGTSTNPSLVNYGQSNTTFDPGPLNEANTYYWKIVVQDDYNLIIGDVWEFTTLITGSSTVTDIDGNIYQTIVIGNQEWMIENLKVTHYRNGDPIPNIIDNSNWTGSYTGAYCYFDNDYSNRDKYGALYNWYAVDDSRNIAPAGWHVPSDAEIMELEIYLGMSQNQANSTGWRGTNEGSKLAGNEGLWSDGALESDPEFNNSNFCLLPGGGRRSFGHFVWLGADAQLWSTSQFESNSSGAWIRYLYSNNTDVSRGGAYKYNGYSVRCVKD